MFKRFIHAVDWKHFAGGFFISFVLSVFVFLYLGISFKKALFGFFYFLITPFLSIPSFPVSLLVLIILFMLFKRVGSCMRYKLRYIAYALLFLHWEAFGFYCSGYVSI
jgi:hypothetical protein